MARYEDGTEDRIPETGDEPPAPPPVTPPPPPPGTSAPNSPQSSEERKRQIVSGIIVPDYQSILGRDPNQAEVDEAYALYAAQGGDAHRAALRARMGSGPKGGANGDFVWGSDFGAPPAPFGETYTTLPRPAWLQGEYTPLEWKGGDFKAPTMAEVQAEPGFQTGLNTGIQTRERLAAAKGSILSGGTQTALTRYGTDYGATKYGESFGRAFDTYKERYGQFLNQAQQQSQARGINENAYQTDVANNATQYGTRYTSYLNDVLNKRNAESDWWNRDQDRINNSLTAEALRRPATPA